MKHYTLLGEYTLAEGQKTDTCDHCGRAIKSVYMVKDNVTGETLKVGMVCIGKIMNLNESFEKALTKELKKYKKTVDMYEKRVNINLLESIKRQLENNSQLDKDNYNYSDPRIIVRDTINNIWFSLQQLIRETEKLNKLSKSGLIDISKLDEYKNQLKEFDERFKTINTNCDWNYDLSKEFEILNILNQYI
jgi:transcription elongation factor Elf1